MPRLLLMTLFILGLPVSACATDEFRAPPMSLSDQFSPGDVYAGIRLLGALRLASTTIHGLRLCGLSGLAWDEDEGLLYAISDIGGLFHLRPQFNAQGHLTGMESVAAYPLRDPLDQPIRAPYDDAEGLTLRNSYNQQPGDSELLVSFEVKPRIVRYRPTGLWKGEERLPARLRDLRSYPNNNQALEAITLDAKEGILVGTEAPLRADPVGQVRIFRRDGQFWRYPLSNAASSALVAMEALPEGGLLTLERAFVAPLRPLVISLRRISLPPPDSEASLKVTDVAIFDSSQGWLMDNFEGLTRYRDRQFFMISDDNCSAWQSTLLMHFEWLPAPATD